MKPGSIPAPKPLPSSASEVGAEVQSILESSDYRFCHDPAYPWTDTEAEWCRAVGDRNDRCGALARACKGEMTHMHGFRRVRSGEGRESEEDPLTFRLPSIGPIGSAVLWAMLAAALALVIGALWRRSFAMRQKAKSAQSKGDEETGALSDEKSAVEIDVERLLERARRAAAMGKFDDGITHAYAALLRQLEGERLLRVDRWRTNGDYLRDLAPLPEIRGPVGRVVHSVEGVQFGSEAPTRERFESVMDQVVAILRASGARGMRGAGAVSTAAILGAALLLGSCTGVHLRGRQEDSPSGTSAVLELFRRAGLEPRARMRSLSKPLDSDQVVLLPFSHVAQEEWQRLLDWVGQGGVLIVANQDDWLSTWPGLTFTSCAPGSSVTLTVGDTARAGGAASIAVPGTSALEIPAAAPTHDVLLRRDESIYAARFDYGAGTLIALADGRLFTNASLAMADNAAFLLSLVDYRGNKKKIDFVDDLTGSGAKTPLSSVHRGKLAPVLSQLALGLVLFFLYKGVAFGSLVDPPRERRRSFAEHVRALGLLYAKAHAADHARSIYGTYVLERLRDNALFRDQKGIGALAEKVAARSGQPLGKVALLLVEAQEPRSVDPKDKGSHEDLDLIRRLSRLLQQSKGGPQ